MAVTVNKIKYIGDPNAEVPTVYVEYLGTHGDEKPESGEDLTISDNSLFFELDTGDMYYWETDAWNKVGG